MVRNHFFDINGNVGMCLYPEGRDPLLMAWNRGERDTHPTWFNMEFWKNVERLRVMEHDTAMRGYERKKALKAMAQG